MPSDHQPCEEYHSLLLMDVLSSQSGWINITPGSHINNKMHILFLSTHSEMIRRTFVCAYVLCIFVLQLSFLFSLPSIQPTHSSLNLLCFLSSSIPSLSLHLCFYMFSGVRASLQVREVSSEGEIRAQKGQRR